MDAMSGPSRRALMASIAGLSMGGAAPNSAAATSVGGIDKANPILVAYFSRSGNTRVVAGLLKRSLNADLFEIQLENPYPEDYLATVEQARQERDRSVEPSLKAKVPDMARYATVFLGLPIWGETVPPIIRSFLTAHNLAGKTLIPFITHGGYGLGTSERIIALHASKAKLRSAFIMQADQERQTMERVNTWLGNG